MERAETDPRSGDMRKVPDKHRFPPFCMEEKGEAWKEGYLHTLIISDFLLQGLQQPSVVHKQVYGKGAWRKSKSNTWELSALFPM